jgi:N-acetylmuramoyl-L-alanine amidase
MKISRTSMLMAILFAGFSLLSAHTAGVNGNSHGSPTSYRMKTVVIDAGHGGKDYGCSGKNSHEKTIALKIALQLGAMIEEKYPDIKVIYTRKTDIFIELHERAAIANRNNADLFICIHCNANTSSSPFGTETYVMGLHKTEANLAVAKRENDVILMENNYNLNYDGFDPNNPASHIIFSLNQHAYMEQSILFASLIESHFKNHAKRTSRGVKQAGFLVLWKSAMPSVLIETGFLTNASEEKVLASESGQKLIAESILFAFADYKSEIENTGIPVETTASTANTGLASGLEYRVQFYTDTDELKTDHSTFSKLKNEPISYIHENGLYKYRLGPYANLQAAVEKQGFARQAGFQDAFVIALHNGKRITLEEAKTLAAE